MNNDSSLNILLTARNTASAAIAQAKLDVQRLADGAKDAASNASKNFAGWQTAIDNTASSLNNAADKVGGLLTKMALLGVAGAFGIGAAAKASWDQVSAVQQSTIALSAYEKDAGKVNAVLKDLVSYARSDLGVLFNRKDLFASAQNLKIYGDNTADLTDHVKILSRSVGLGLSSWEGLNNVIGRVGSTGKLYADDLQYLQNAGFKLDSSLSGSTQTFQSLFTLLDKGIPADALDGQANTIVGMGVRMQTAFRGIGDAILGVDSDTGKFVAGGAGDKLLQLMGQLTAVMKQPEIKAAFASIGNQIAELAKGAIPKLIEGIKFMANNFDKIILGIKILIGLFIVLKAAALFMNILSVAIGAVRVAITLWTAAQWLLNFALSANPIGIIIIAIIALIAAIVLLWNNSETFRNIVTGVFSAVWGAIKAVWDWISANWPLLLAILTGPIGIAVLLIVTHWDTIKGAFNAAWEFIKGVWSAVAGFFGSVWQGIVNAFAAVGSFFVNIFQNAWNGIKNIFSGVAGFFKGVWDTIVSVFGSVGAAVADTITGAVKGVINGILSGAEKIVNGFVGAINGVVGTINKIPGVNIGKIGNLNLPRLAKGGIVQPRPGGVIANIAEAGKAEAVIPLDRLERMIAGSNGGGGGSGVTLESGASLFTINYTGDPADFSESQAADMAQKIMRVLRAQGLTIDNMGAVR